MTDLPDKNDCVMTMAMKVWWPLTSNKTKESVKQGENVKGEYKKHKRKMTKWQVKHNPQNKKRQMPPPQYTYKHLPFC